MQSKDRKSLAQRTREELSLSDDGKEEDDDEVLLAHREEMVQFMIDVHRRRKRVIEEYERKESVRYIIHIYSVDGRSNFTNHHRCDMLR